MIGQISLFVILCTFGVSQSAWTASQGLAKCFPGLTSGSSTTTCMNSWLESTCNSTITNYGSVAKACTDTTSVAQIASLRKQCCFSCYLKLIDSDTFNKAVCRTVSTDTIKKIQSSTSWSDQSWCSTTGYTPCYSSYASCAEVQEDLLYCPKKCFSLA